MAPFHYGAAHRWAVYSSHEWEHVRTISSLVQPKHGNLHPDWLGLHSELLVLLITYGGAIRKYPLTLKKLLKALYSIR